MEDVLAFIIWPENNKFDILTDENEDTTVGN